MIVQWEYKVEMLSSVCSPTIGIRKTGPVSGFVEIRLNEIGREGWELVEISPTPPDPCNPGVLGLFYFKRPVKPLL